MALIYSSEPVDARSAYIHEADYEWARFGSRRITGPVELSVKANIGAKWVIVSKDRYNDQENVAAASTIPGEVTLSNPGSMPPSTIIKDAQFLDHSGMARDAQVYLDSDRVWATARSRAGIEVWGRGDSEGEALRELALNVEELETPVSGDPVEEWFQLNTK